MKKTLLGYVPEKSPVYIFHPFTRLFLLLALTFIPLFIVDLGYNLTLIGTTLCLFVISRVRLSVLRFYIPIFLILFCFIMAIYTFFAEPAMQDEALTSFMGITFYRGALLFGLKIYVRILSIFFLTIYFLHVMTESEIVVALRSIRVPFIVSYTLGLSLRAIGMFMEDYRVVREAEKARALDLSEMHVFQKLLKLFNYVVPLLALAVRRTDEFSDAITSRAFSFSGLGRRPNYLSSKHLFRRHDVLATLAIVAVTTGTLMVYFGL